MSSIITFTYCSKWNHLLWITLTATVSFPLIWSSLELSHYLFIINNKRERHSPDKVKGNAIFFMFHDKRWRMELLNYLTLNILHSISITQENVGYCLILYWDIDWKILFVRVLLIGILESPCDKFGCYGIWHLVQRTFKIQTSVCRVHWPCNCV